MSYHVDSADGRCLYRGNDLELACESHDDVADAHLVVRPAPRSVSELSAQMPWKGPAVLPDGSM